MNHRKRLQREQRSLAGDVGPEDGIDPRRLPRRGRRGGPGRKSLQLCAQAAQTLSMVLGSECGDELLRDLQVVEVLPAPDASRLLVVLALAPSANAWSPAEMLSRLDRYAPRLRAEVAAAIHRRRAPELLFRLMG